MNPIICTAVLEKNKEDKEVNRDNYLYLYQNIHNKYLLTPIDKSPDVFSDCQQFFVMKMVIGGSSEVIF